MIPLVLFGDETNIFTGVRALTFLFLFLFLFSLLAPKSRAGGIRSASASVSLIVNHILAPVNMIDQRATYPISLSSLSSHGYWGAQFRSPLRSPVSKPINENPCHSYR
ncbi:hypothetical protein B0T17DRAFT_516509 [Bombardia bombarda]|uniref:Uncharacterized protein n=1 Tax=Bombardia bombarda TaxID=252184 RepID=A0AA40CEH1_9PEZI|nr:hypothetical protein B0T17DRAFT_516509 [Bombardia bombarda]